MSDLDQARARVEEAAGLAALLDAAYAAFILLVPVIERQQDPASAWFVPFVMAGSPAAAGRFALLDAPSLPEASRALGFPEPDLLPARETAAAVASLAEMLARRLGDAAIAAGQPDDRQACAQAAQCARDVRARLGSAPLP
jgi:hypothetical protein